MILAREIREMYTYRSNTAKDIRNGGKNGHHKLLYSWPVGWESQREMVDGAIAYS